MSTNKTELDLPESLCVVPFVHLGTKPDGVARVCCFAPQLELKDGDQLIQFPESSIEAAWNGESMRKIRMKMLQGEKLSECSKCWKQESSNSLSKRVRENEKYLSATLPKIRYASENGGAINESPQYFDLRLGNRCNLKCRTCNPIFSGSWSTELKSQNLQSFDKDTKNQLSFMLERSERMSPWYKDSFFSELKEIAADLKEVYISGGEPMLIPELEEFVSFCVDQGFASNIEVRLNSNITVIKKSLLDKLSCFKRVDFGASIDAFGQKNDWIRNPSRWPQLIKNLTMLYDFGEKNRNFVLSTNITVSIYNVLYIDQLIECLRKDYGSLPFTFDYVEDPKYMSLSLMSEPIKSMAIDRLKNIPREILSQKDVKKIDQLCGFIKKREISTSDQLLFQFLNHTKEVDLWREEDARSVFPELFSFFEKDHLHLSGQI